MGGQVGVETLGYGSVWHGISAWYGGIVVGDGDGGEGDGAFGVGVEDAEVGMGALGGGGLGLGLVRPTWWGGMRCTCKGRVKSGPRSLSGFSISFLRQHLSPVIVKDCFTALQGNGVEIQFICDSRWIYNDCAMTACNRTVQFWLVASAKRGSAGGHDGNSTSSSCLACFDRVR